LKKEIFSVKKLNRRYAMEGKKEFRISLPNQPGQLALVCEALGRAGVNILSVAAIGAANPVVALAADQEDKTREALEELNLDFQEVELLTVNVPHRPGELGALTKKMGEANINIESIYLLEESSGEVKVAFTVSDLAKAKQELGL
jgi:hypothetical protein